MEILTIKQQSNGWLVNGTLSIPNDDGNSDCRIVKEYIANGGIVEPEFTQAELDTQTRSAFRASRDILLTNTDMYMLVDRYNMLSTAEQTELINYRQSLRDATITWTMPTILTWL